MEYNFENLNFILFCIFTGYPIQSIFVNCYKTGE